MHSFLKRHYMSLPLYLLLFTSVDTILFGTNTSFAFKLVPRLLGLLFSFLFLTYYRKNRKIDNSVFIAFLFLVALFLISNLYNKNDLFGMFSRSVSILTGFSIAVLYDRHLFVKTFKNFVYAVSIVSMAVELTAYMFPALFYLFPIVSNSVGHSFSVFFFGSLEISEIGNTAIRSNGIFWEPGAFAIYLILALMFELFFSKRISKKRVFVFILSIIITFSTTGYICLSCLLILYILYNKREKQSKLIKATIILSACCVLALSLLSNSTFLFDSVFSKIFEKNSSAGSRFSSLFNGLFISFKNPLLGVGDSSNDIMKDYMETTNTWYANGGSNINNTFTGYMASYGLLFGLVLVYGCFKFLKVKGHSFAHILLFAVLVLAFCGERFFSFLPFTLMFYGFKKTYKKKYFQSEVMTLGSIGD